MSREECYKEALLAVERGEISYHEVDDYTDRLYYENRGAMKSK